MVVAFVCLATTLGVLGGCSPSPQQPTVRRTDTAAPTTSTPSSVGFTRFSAGQGPMLPVLSGDDLAGRSMTVPDVAAAPVTVVNVWASWCGPCVAEMPKIGAAANRFADDGVAVRGLDTRDTPKAATAFLADVAVDLPSLSDPSGSQAARWSAIVPASAVPSTLLIDRTGRVRARWIGPLDATGLDREICLVLTEQGADSTRCPG